MADSKPVPARRGRKIGEVAPALPVLKKENVTGDFYIVAPAPRQFDGRYGNSWAVTIEAVDGGAKGVILMASNDVRDQSMEALAHEIKKDSAASFGPCYLEKIELPGNPNPMWEIKDRE